MAASSDDSSRSRRAQLRQAVVRRARVLLVLSGFATAAGWLGEYYWVLELFSHFIACYAVLSLLLALVFSWCRRRRWACAAALLFAVQAAFPLAWYSPPPVRNSGAPPNCRVLLANVLSTNPDKQSFLNLVANTDPDVVCVQEVDRAWAAALKSLETDYPVHTVVPRPDNFGIAVYSRLPGPPPEVLFQREYQVPAITLTLTVNGRPLQLLTAHMLPPAGSELASGRNAQLQATRAWILDQKVPVVVVGDLNLTMFSPLYRRLVGGTGARNARAGFGPIGTWPAWLPWLRLPLDQCLVTGDILVTDCTAGPRTGSDHLPLLIDLMIPPA